MVIVLSGSEHLLRVEVPFADKKGLSGICTFYRIQNMQSGCLGLIDEL
jgi:hypothetical protein